MSALYLTMIHSQNVSQLLLHLNLKSLGSILPPLVKRAWLETPQMTEEKSGYTYFWSGKGPDEPRHSGVGFAIKSKLAKSLPTFPKGVSDRLMTLTLNLEYDRRAILISCYAPPLNRPEQEKNEFYQQLREIVASVQHSDKLILLGDFNARVGTDNASWGGVLGNHGVGSYE